MERYDGERVVALAGNPNVGKSTLFNALTGLRQHTGNWSGKTVALARGRVVSATGRYILVDLPGTYSIVSHSPEEEVARGFLCSGQAAATVVVCDSTRLERGLTLALQVMAVCPRTVVCLNLADEARRAGVVIDDRLLERLLGVPVVTTAARSKEGLETLLQRLDALLEAPAAFSSAVYPTGPEPDDPAATVQRAQQLAERCTMACCDRSCLQQRRLDRLLTSKLTGIPVMLLLLAAVLWLTITGANYPSRMLSQWLFGLEPMLRGGLVGLGAPQWLCGLLVDGGWRVLAWVVSVMLPPMAIFFPLFTLLEDLGYLPRVAYNLDHLFERCHTCGKQSLTLCMGLGCNAAGVTGCRIIDSPRERLIAILTNSLVPCNGRFPTLVALITVFFAGTGGLRAALLLTLLVAVGLAATFAASALLSRTLLRGVPSAFTLELPPLRRPQVGQVLVRSVLDRTLFVLGRAAAVAAPAGLCIWLMANLQWHGVSLLAHTSALLDPLGHLMGMDGVILLAFVLGFPANEIVLPLIVMAYTASGSLAEPSLSALGGLLAANGWTPWTAVCVMLFSLMHWPCSTTCLTIHKETGSWYWTAIGWLLPTLFGFVACTLVAALGRFCSAL